MIANSRYRENHDHGNSQMQLVLSKPTVTVVRRPPGQRNLIEKAADDHLVALRTFFSVKVRSVDTRPCKQLMDGFQLPFSVKITADTVKSSYEA